jgi:hypothetical protein
MNLEKLFLALFTIAPFIAGCGGDVTVLQSRSGVGSLDASSEACDGGKCPNDQADAGGVVVDSGGGTTALSWYTTCGDPICLEPDGGAPPAPTCAPLGSPCTTKGETCGDPTASCGVVQVCDDHDPKGSPPNCPISSRKYKDDVVYVDPAELKRLHDETLAMRLATYRYKGPFIRPDDPNARHLGFVVEDQPASLAVDRGHDRVDLYGYMSMAVATMQVQEKEIAALRGEIDALKRSCAAKR